MKKPKLERWIPFHDCVVGYIFDDPKHRNGVRVKTDAIHAECKLLHPGGEVVCNNGETYQLGEMGNLAEHNVDLPGGVWRRPWFYWCRA